MKRMLPIILCAGAVIFLFFPACVSQPAASAPGSTQPAATEKKAPDWFYKTPEEDATFKYFVGSGSSSKRDAKEAETNAVQDLIDKIFLYIGIEVTSETEAKGIGSLDDFKTEITQVVSTTGKGQLSGFEIMEKLPHETSDNLIIYILSRYNKKDLEKEKLKIEKEIQEKYEAISVPEQQGQELAAAGRYYEAAAKFIQAADAAAGEKVSNAQVKFERNIKQAMDALEKVNLIRLTGVINGLAGQELPEPITLKVVSGATEKSPGVPNAAIRIVYKGFNAAKTRLQSKSATQKTDKSGILAFKHPVPEFTGKETVTMVLDFDEYIETLDDVPEKWYNSVEALKSLIADKKTVFEFNVTSNAKNINTGIAVIDIDQDGNPINAGRTAPSLLQYLSSQKYKVRTLNIKADQIVDQSDPDIIETIAAGFKDKVDRALFGTARILDRSKSDGMIVVKSTASVQVVDLATGEILLSVVKSVNGLGNSDDKATAESFKNLGEEIGKYILNNLR